MRGFQQQTQLMNTKPFSQKQVKSFARWIENIQKSKNFNLRVYKTFGHETPYKIFDSVVKLITNEKDIDEIFNPK